MNEALRGCFSDVLRRPMPDFTEDLAFAELPGWDSVVHLTLLLAVESRFGIAFSSAEMVSMKRVGDMTAVIKAHGGTP